MTLPSVIPAKAGIQYGVDRLVWFEQHDSMGSAILREKQIKAWKRSWKIEMIEKANPYWRDLWPDITGAAQGAGFLLSQE